MLARKILDPSFVAWNERYGAPFGCSVRFPRLIGFFPESMRIRIRGYFSIQPNNTTRAFEYPWAFYSLGVIENQNILEIGGGLSGFQFVLSKMGGRVVNIDPGMDAKGVGWPCTPQAVDRLNRIFGTNVRLFNTTIDKADLRDLHFDSAVCISVVEHLPEDDRRNLISRVFDLLKPGGIFVLTVDLFPGLFPFTDEKSNEWGGNIDLYDLIKDSGFSIVHGDRSELYGFDEFDPQFIEKNKGLYFCGHYPAYAQCLVLKKPG